jgi:hypothetical protein
VDNSVDVAEFKVIAQKIEAKKKARDETSRKDMEVMSRAIINELGDEVVDNAIDPEFKKSVKEIYNETL